MFLRRKSTIAIALTLCALPLSAAPEASAAGAQDSLVWKSPKTVTRVVKKGRAPRVRRPATRVEKVPLLTLSWLVRKRDPGGAAKETNATSTFYTGDQLQLQFSTNQPGYLYIINQSETKDGTVVEPPEIIFPNSRINQGQNYVEKEQLFVIPATCPEFGDRANDCWWSVAPPTGREVFIVIFSRDMITDLPNKIVATGPTRVNRDQIMQIKNESGQKIVRTSRPELTPEKGGGAGRFVTWVTNTNPNDNEELIETIVLTHEDRPVS